MDESTKDDPKPLTKQQLPGWSGGYGGAYFPGGAYPTRSDAGVTILPSYAAVRGSGALEGRNPYEPFTEWGGGFGFGGLFGIGPENRIWPGTYHTYRLMLSYPLIALTYAAITSPILAGRWSYEADDDAPKEAAEVVEAAFDRMRVPLVRDALRGVIMGFAPFEVMWGVNYDGFKVPKLRALLPDLTDLRIGEHGELAGIANSGVTLDDPRKFFVWTHDREGDNHYGRSRLENLRRTWANCLTAEDRLAKLDAKASGILPKVMHPPDWKEGLEAADTNRQKALRMIRDMQTGLGIAFETPLTQDMVSLNPDVLKVPLVTVELLDMGDCGPSQGAMQKRIDQLQRDMVRGMLRSERTVIEAQTAGSRADAEAHTASISDTDSDRLHADIVDAINEQVVKPMLVENFGPKCADCVRIVPKEIVDENRVVDQKLLDGIIQNPSAFPELLMRIDLEGWAKRNGIKLRPDAEPFDEMALPTAQEQFQTEKETAQAKASQFSDKPIGEDQEAA